MTKTARTRPTVGARRFGYVVAVLVNAAMLYAVNRWPGWEVLPFLTADLVLVLGLVNASIVVNLAANLVYLVRDPRWLRALGDLLTTAVGLVALVRMWQVFPFDFSGDWAGWTLVVRILLGLGIVGSAIGLVTACVSFAKGVTTRPSDRAVHPFVTPTGTSSSAAAVSASRDYSGGANAWKKIGKVPRTPSPMRTSVTVSAFRDSTSLVRYIRCSTAQATSQMMTAPMVFPDSGPTGSVIVRNSLKPSLASARVVRMPSASAPTPAARIAAATGPSGLSTYSACSGAVAPALTFDAMSVSYTRGAALVISAPKSPATAAKTNASTNSTIVVLRTRSWRMRLVP